MTRGSSPRMRGTLIPHLRRAGRTGIIPAYAGNTGFRALPRLRCGDHPRVCGEHLFDGERACCGMGSSPRMRGTPNPRRSAPRRRGIIPAYAGNTDNLTVNRVHPRDHPRVCGEHDVHGSGFAVNQGSSPRMRGTQSATIQTLLRGGSSPRMRGTHGRRISRSVRRGIIPAYAGNTAAPHASASILRDHPRVCGEHINEKVKAAITLGSSPRMRGTP